MSKDNYIRIVVQSNNSKTKVAVEHAIQQGLESALPGKKVEVYTDENDKVIAKIYYCKKEELEESLKDWRVEIISKTTN